MKGRAQRKANIELLRIFSMLGITMLHCLYWNDALLLDTNSVSALRVVGSVLESFFVPSVAVYVLISGYCNTSTQLRPGRLFGILAQVWFYSVLLHLILVFAGIAEPAKSIWDLAMYVLPVMTGHYWFATAFVVLEILTPLLNAAVQEVSKKTLEGVLICLLIYESIIKTIVPFQLSQDGQGYDFGFFILVFLIGAWLRTYGIPGVLASRPRALAGYLGSCAVTALVQIGASFLHERTGSFSYLMNAPFHYNYLFALSASVCLFLFFLTIHIPEGYAAKTVRTLSMHTFGVYLIQCHADLLPLWPVFWMGVAGLTSQSAAVVFFFVWMAVGAVAVFLVCSALDAVRGVLFERVACLVSKIRKKDST